MNGCCTVQEAKHWKPGTVVVAIAVCFFFYLATNEILVNRKNCGHIGVTLWNLNVAKNLHLRHPAKWVAKSSCLGHPEIYCQILLGEFCQLLYKQSHMTILKITLPNVYPFTNVAESHRILSYLDKSWRILKPWLFTENLINSRPTSLCHQGKYSMAKSLYCTVVYSCLGHLPVQVCLTLVL